MTDAVSAGIKGALPIGKRIRSEAQTRDRGRGQLSIRLQTTILLELLNCVLGALPPDPIHGASVEAQTAQTPLDGADRRLSESLSRRHRRRKSRLLRAQQSGGIKAQSHGSRLVQLTGYLQLVARLKSL
jgi:hypothetical protein